MSRKDREAVSGVTAVSGDKHLPPTPQSCFPSHRCGLVARAHKTIMLTFLMLKMVYDGGGETVGRLASPPLLERRGARKPHFGAEGEEC